MFLQSCPSRIASAHLITYHLTQCTPCVFKYFKIHLPHHECLTYYTCMDIKLNSFWMERQNGWHVVKVDKFRKMRFGVEGEENLEKVLWYGKFGEWGCRVDADLGTWGLDLSKILLLQVSSFEQVCTFALEWWDDILSSEANTSDRIRLTELSCNMSGKSTRWKGTSNNFGHVLHLRFIIDFSEG